MLCLLGQAQVTRKYGMGLADDYEAIRQMPMKKELLTRSYEGLPKSSSLQQYCPRAGSQGDYATCTAWATTTLRPCATNKKNHESHTPNDDTEDRTRGLPGTGGPLRPQ